MSVEVADESGLDYEVVSLAEQARFALDRLRIHPQAELSIALVTPQVMEDLHVRHMDEPGPTDVLSFPMDELRQPGDDEEMPEGMLGDIVICPEVAREQADKAGHDERHEMGVLLTHGILHLLGYDHAEPDEERLMFGLQARLVDEWERLGGRARA